jgi:hypothetical protein
MRLTLRYLVPSIALQATLLLMWRSLAVFLGLFGRVSACSQLALLVYVVLTLASSDSDILMEIDLVDELANATVNDGNSTLIVNSIHYIEIRNHS